MSASWRIVIGLKTEELRDKFLLSPCLSHERKQKIDLFPPLKRSGEVSEVLLEEHSILAGRNFSRY